MNAGCFNNERRSARPADGSQWVDAGGEPYTVRYTSKYTVYTMHHGQERLFKLGDFIEMMIPLDEFLAAQD